MPIGFAYSLNESRQHHFWAWIILLSLAQRLAKSSRDQFSCSLHAGTFSTLGDINLPTNDHVRHCPKDCFVVFAAACHYRAPRNSITFAGFSIMMSIPQVADALQISHQSATRYINALETAGILHETTGQSRNRIYLAGKVLNVIESAQTWQD